MLQWIAGFEKAAATSHFIGSNRFDSFAPIRMNVSAQWLVDGVGPFSLLAWAFGSFLAARLLLESITCNITCERCDLYPWLVALAWLVLMKQVALFSWLGWYGTELNLRRPGMPKYRLDNLLEKKAKEGVKIFIIL
jgi:phospholipase D1/2